jgi:hypothetical protein
MVLHLDWELSGVRFAQGVMRGRRVDAEQQSGIPAETLSDHNIV